MQFESAEVQSLLSEWGVYLSPRTHACVLGKKRVLQFFVLPFACCLLQMHPKLKKRVVQIKIHIPFLIFSLLSFLWFICHLQSLTKKTTNKPTKPNSSYLHLLLPAFLVLLQICKTILSWMVAVETETHMF